jgi:signal transduction histidine kinase
MMRGSGGAVRDWAESRPWTVDLALALLVTLVSLPPLWQLDEATVATGFDGPNPLTVAIALAMTVPLAWRRRAPLVVMLVVAVGYVGAATLSVPTLPLGLLIAVYTLAGYATRRAVGWGMGAVAASTVVSLVLVGEPGSLVPNLLVLGATGLFGDWQRLQRARARELVRREEQLRLAKDELTRLAVERERQRIAEELRDVLAHAVTAMVTQAHAARRLARSSTDGAIDHIRTVEETSRGALVELRRLVGLLRDEPVEVVPPPARVRADQDDTAVVGTAWMERWRQRLAGTTPFMRDLVLVVVLVAAELSLQLVTHGPGVASVSLVVVPASMVLLRRRFPQTVLSVALAGTVAIVLLDIPTVFNVVLVAIYTVANLCPPRVRIAWLVAAAVVAGWLLLPEGIGYLAGQLLFIGGAWLLGDRQRVGRQYRTELEERGRELEAAQRRAVELGVAVERTRIARDLHDVVGASIGVMLTLAGGARRMLARDPQRADEALEQVISCGRESLAHLRGVLPGDDGVGSGLAPQPTLDELPRLVGELDAVGLRVDLQVVGEPTTVPAGVGLSAYRIVQEALTNVLKHAGTDRAVVRLRHDDTLELEITDDGPTGRAGVFPAPDLGGSGGHGLIGMAERARLVGGHLEVGPRAGRGYRVLARLPLVAIEEAPDAAAALAAT